MTCLNAVNRAHASKSQRLLHYTQLRRDLVDGRWFFLCVNLDHADVENTDKTEENKIHLEAICLQLEKQLTCCWPKNKNASHTQIISVRGRTKLICWLFPKRQTQFVTVLMHLTSKLPQHRWLHFISKSWHIGAFTCQVGELKKIGFLHHRI